VIATRIDASYLQPAENLRATSHEQEGGKDRQAMRFLPDGADIPDDLIRAVKAGGVVFLCGAGVSRRVDFPSFKGLTDQIYDRLGETRTDEAPEQKAFGRGEYDRVLRSLEKRTHRPGNPLSRVREAAAALLAAKDGAKLPDHLALLELSRDADGRPKLLTSNFDTNFERAADDAGMTDVRSHAGKALPKPGGPLDHGSCICTDASPTLARSAT